MQITYEIENSWMTAEEPREGSTLLSLHASEEELLFSGTSMTQHLEELLGAPIEVETRVGRTMRLGPEEAKALGVNVNAKAQEREVWLNIKGRKLVYAHTLIPIVSVDEALLRTLKERKDEPIGRVLTSLKVPFLKKALEVAILTSAEVTAELALPPETRLVARRYILYNDTSDTTIESPAIQAAVTEIFNPEIVSCRPCEN